MVATVGRVAARGGSAGVEERAERIGRNEAAVRIFNEGVRRVTDALELPREPEPTPVLELVCECGDASCTQRVVVEVAEYERVRTHPERFLVVPGHVARDVERVVAPRGGYDVIEKVAGGPAELARATDPRR